MTARDQIVDDTARAAPKPARSVTVEWIDGALPDVFLSRHEAREEAYARLGRWVDGWAAADRAARITAAPTTASPTTAPTTAEPSAG